MSDKKRKLEDLVRQVSGLSQDDFVTVMCTIATENPHPEVASYITNKWQKVRSEERKGKSSTNDGMLFEKPPPQQLKAGRDGKDVMRSRALESSPLASLPDIHGISAWKVPVIFRGDLVPHNGKLFLDVEKLTLKRGYIRHEGEIPKHTPVANNIAIVNEKGILIFWAFIRRDCENVCQFYTNIHRITKAKLLEGVPLETVRPILEKCFKGNTVVGAKLKDDLMSLSTMEEFRKKMPFNHRDVIDLQHFFRDANKQPYKLKHLFSHFFPDKARDYQKEFHSSISDARVTLDLYLKMCSIKEQNPKIVDASGLKIV